VTGGLEFCIVDVLWKWLVETPTDGPEIAPAVSLLEWTVIDLIHVGHSNCNSGHMYIGSISIHTSLHRDGSRIHPLRH
jgi:hypothetical protein